VLLVFDFRRDKSRPKTEALGKALPPCAGRALPASPTFPLAFVGSHGCCCPSVLGMVGEQLGSCFKQVVLLVKGDGSHFCHEVARKSRGTGGSIERQEAKQAWHSLEIIWVF